MCGVVLDAGNFVDARAFRQGTFGSKSGAGRLVQSGQLMEA